MGSTESEPPAWTAVYPGRVWRQCYCADGRPKRKMRRTEAKRVQREMGRKGEIVRAYHCPLCQWWHVGSERAG